MERKPWKKQKTTWAGLLAIGLAAGGFFTGGLTWPAALQLGMPGLIGIFLRQGVEGVKPAMIVLLLIPALMFMPGCAALQQQAEQANVPPPGCEDSVIYSSVPYPKAVGSLIQVATYNVAIEVGGAKAAILRVVDRIEVGVQPIADGTATMDASVFVAMVIQEIKQLNNRYAVSLLIVAENLEALNVPVPLTQCDGELIMGQLASIRQWVNVARPGE